MTKPLTFLLLLLCVVTSLAHADTLFYATVPGLGVNVPVQKLINTNPPNGWSSFTITMAGTQPIVDNLNGMQACTGTCILGTSYVEAYSDTGGTPVFAEEYIFDNTWFKQVQSSSFCAGCVDATFAYTGVFYSLTQTQPPPPSSTPEPSTLLLLGTGITAAFGMRRRRSA